MTPDERLDDIEHKLSCAGWSEDIDLNDIIWLANRVKELTEALGIIAADDLYTQENKSARSVARKALAVSHPPNSEVIVNYERQIEHLRKCVEVATDACENDKKILIKELGQQRTYIETLTAENVKMTSDLKIFEKLKAENRNGLFDDSENLIFKDGKLIEYGDGK